MKNLGKVIVVSVLIMWYLMSIIGFSVHHCSDDDTIYFGTAYAELTCETTHGKEHINHHSGCDSVAHQAYSGDCNCNIGHSCEEHNCCESQWEHIDILVSPVKDDNSRTLPLVTKVFPSSNIISALLLKPSINSVAISENNNSLNFFNPPILELNCTFLI